MTEEELQSLLDCLCATSKIVTVPNTTGGPSALLLHSTVCSAPIDIYGKQELDGIRGSGIERPPVSFASLAKQRQLPLPQHTPACPSTSSKNNVVDENETPPKLSVEIPLEMAGKHKLYATQILVAF